MIVSRRAFLAAVPLGLAVGCRDRSPARPDPDAAALAAARDTELRLVLAYDGRQRDEHLAHLTALGGTPPTSLPPPGGPIRPTGLARSSVASLQAAAIGAHSGQVAATLASIAAAHLAGP
jgi:hypothetical protein